MGIVVASLHGPVEPRARAVVKKWKADLAEEERRNAPPPVPPVGLIPAHIRATAMAAEPSREELDARRTVVRFAPAAAELGEETADGVSAAVSSIASVLSTSAEVDQPRSVSMPRKASVSMSEEESERTVPTPPNPNPVMIPPPKQGPISSGSEEGSGDSAGDWSESNGESSEEESGRGSEGKDEGDSTDAVEATTHVPAPAAAVGARAPERPPSTAATRRQPLRSPLPDTAFEGVEEEDWALAEAELLSLVESEDAAELLALFGDGVPEDDARLFAEAGATLASRRNSSSHA